MKYLKKFENVSKYKIGDYFLLKGEYFNDGKPRFSKLINIDNDAKDPISYEVVLWNWIELETMWVGGWMIERELNSEEKDYLELELEKDKFNI